MPSLTLNATQDQYDKLITVLNAVFERNEGEANGAFIKRWITQQAKDLVIAYNKKKAIENLSSVLHRRFYATEAKSVRCD